MAAFFTIGEKKTIPDVYVRYENYGSPPLAGADDGKCAAVFRSDWGPLDKALIMEKHEDITKFYGTGGTTAVPLEQFKGGARLVYGVRLGTGGKQGSYEIKDTAGSPAVKLTLKYPGSRKFSVAIRPTLEDSGMSELLLLEGTTELERIKFNSAADSDQITALIEAAADSSYFTLTKLANGGETTAAAIAAVDQAEVTGGEDPKIDAEAYSTAFEILEAHRWNVLSIDTNNTAIQDLTQMYLDRIYQEGAWVMGVVGEDKSVDFETRLKHASVYNDYKMIYVGNGGVDALGNRYEGYLAAARVAGMIAGTPSNEAITHLPVAGWVDLTETMTRNQRERAIKAGMLTFQFSPSNTIWVEQGVNTLVLPGTQEDAGWKKIKRVKTRLELMQRLSDTIEALIGRINNDENGRASIIGLGNGVCNTMVSEKKLLAGAHCELDPGNPPEGDSAWFAVYADDIDALEKIYMTFKFRFSPNN